MNRTTALRKVTTASQNLAKAEASKDSLAWVLADAVIALRATFKDDSKSRKAFKAAAATAAKRSEGMIENLVRAHDLRGSLTAKQREATKDWSYDAILVLSGKDLTSAKRTSIITKAAKQGTQNVKVLRDVKRSVMGTTKRTRKSTAQQTTALVKALSKDLAKLTTKYDPIVLAIGARFAQDHAGKDVASAITFYATQAKAAAAVSS